MRKPCEGCLVDSVPASVGRPVAPVGGADVIITVLLEEPTTVPSADGEWFELHNTNPSGLPGRVHGDQPVGASVTLPSTSLAAGDCFVLVRNADTDVNGWRGRRRDLHFGLLTNGSLTLACGGTTRDETSWTAVTEGQTRSLDPEATTPRTTTGHLLVPRLDAVRHSVVTTAAPAREPAMRAEAYCAAVDQAVRCSGWNGLRPLSMAYCWR